MYPDLLKITSLPKKANIIFIIKSVDNIPKGYFSKEELTYISHQEKKEKQEFYSFNRLDHWLFVQVIKEENDPYKVKEILRKSGDKFGFLLNESKQKEIVLYDAEGQTLEVLTFAEGLLLGQYQFLKYKGKREKTNTLGTIWICSDKIKNTDIRSLLAVTDAVYRCRTLINEPNSFLTAVSFAKEVEKMAKKCGAKVEIMNKSKIEALQMGGLLAVNKGSEVPPTFTIMEWKPEQFVNKTPFVFVGKGVVFDSGGMNLKPGDSMSTMKEDMSGAAAVASAIFAIAIAELPVHVIGLMPATDNRPGPKAIVPGDIIKMQSGLTVEVLNTDAEGRLILADALDYAKKYKPALVIDLATLTGSAIRAVGKIGIVAMQTKAAKDLEQLKESGMETYERIVEFPTWDEYSDGIKSEVADIKNVGPAEAGAITAGKFLEKFTDYPYIHLDIAGPAFLDKRDSYRGQGGTGVGVRLLFDFIKKQAKQKTE
ncbi:MAG: leucyl aminopeptidase family protein [Bacteroidales bacterium]|jgi:leucyl aminopeptidase